ncbi:LptF/LptG family permease [Candidatus Pelagibacter sp.]|uniref:LptF/LptG family permease n=1 Tax=Candidatus Pelagibacter sp. TaxID=2024849 RepID=UPI003F84AC08
MKKLIFKKLANDISFFFLISTISLSTIIWIIQAVNFLDLISEDGHGLRVYFLFTLFSLPKIISKILPFIFMISLFYTIIRYELNNELIIYWMNGITKISFVNILIKVSIIYFLLQLIFTSLLVPYTLDKGRSFFRTSSIDLFSSVIKEKKFIDSVKNLTIFVDEKNKNKLKNVIIKEKLENKNSQIIIARSGNIFNDNSNVKSIILFDGKIINYENKNQNIINFTEFKLDLSKYNSNTITHPKTQEMSSVNLYKCIQNFKNYESPTNINKIFFKGCNTEIQDSIIEEFLKRFFSPLFIILISLTSSLLILVNKDHEKFNLKCSLIFCLSLILLLASEITLRYSSASIYNMVLYLIMPIVSFIILYSFLLLNNKST